MSPAVERWTEAVRVGASLTAIAPPPMIAPPQVAAQSLAIAIRTDILRLPAVASPPFPWKAVFHAP